MKTWLKKMIRTYIAYRLMLVLAPAKEGTFDFQDLLIECFSLSELFMKAHKVRDPKYLK